MNIINHFDITKQITRLVAEKLSYLPSVIIIMIIIIIIIINYYYYYYYYYY